ncbi:MAG: carbamoyltransferase [Candidatus Omnitrophica bacterium]|nr:carbamoyltransferase [Candidatus Omnitrophota bacterium]
MYILGINAYHPDSSACIIKDGELIAAVEEERFKRIKHWSGFPIDSIRYCLEEAGISIADVDFIGISRNPYAHLYKKLIYIIKNRKVDSNIINSRLKNFVRIKNIKNLLIDNLPSSKQKIKSKIYFIEHHKTHMASSFFVSPFKESAILSLDAMGDFVSTMFGIGKDNKIKVLDRIFFPNSLGYLYTAGTQFLGFLKFGDEYKVMGLSAYGKPVYLNEFRKMLILKKNGKFALDSRYFNFSSEGLSMSWHNSEPVCGRLFSKKWIDIFGLPRNSEDSISKRDKDIASSLQMILEEMYFYILNYLYKLTRVDNLCLAGGVALNCVANGKIFNHTPFKNIYIQPAANDAGTALGAVYYIYHQILNKKRCFEMKHAYWGPAFNDKYIESVLKRYNLKFEKYNIEEIIKIVAKYITEGKIVGWFQGRMEWGPRALGNRSILADPRKQEIKFILNKKIKYREEFRPFAPAILLEKIVDFFNINYPEPFMLKTYLVRENKRSLIPAVVHIDGTARIQTVDKDTNLLFWRLLKKFEELTGIGVLLNTSFNENEPIICNPEEAIDCFLRTQIDVLVINSYLIKKNYA